MSHGTLLTRTTQVSSTRVPTNEIVPQETIVDLLSASLPLPVDTPCVGLRKQYPPKVTGLTTTACDYDYTPPSVSTAHQMEDAVQQTDPNTTATDLNAACRSSLCVFVQPSAAIQLWMGSLSRTPPNFSGGGGRIPSVLESPPAV
ncbi:unnamed protein product [Ectocarpus sp. 13 AM-2016]